MLYFSQKLPQPNNASPTFLLSCGSLRRDNTKYLHQVQTAIYTMRNSLSFIMETLHATVEALRALVYGKGIFLNSFSFKASCNRYPRCHIQISTLIPMKVNHSGIPAVTIAFVALNEDAKLILQKKKKKN